MGQTLKLATKAFMATGALVLAASCSTTPPVYSVVPTQKPTQEEIAMLTQLQATDTTALASPDTVAQSQPIDMATDRSVAMAYAIPQPKPLAVANDAAQAIDTNLAMATPDNNKVKTRSIEIASVDPAVLQLQPSTDTSDNSVTANAMVDTSTRSLQPFVSSTRNANLNQLIAKYSALYDVPEPLIHHVVRRESNYNPAAVHRGNWGLMQIRYNTARGLGYDGSPTGLLDAETNLKYAVKYLKGAWIVAEKDAKKADWLYRTGYYYEAKRMGLLDEAGLQ